MNIWHDTVDAPRTPRRVSPAQDVELTVGTWPIEPGQSVWATWERVAATGSATKGTVAAEWQRNAGANSYWTAHLGPFADGDLVTYIVHGASSEGAVQTGAASLRVRPALYVAWLWHHHQPLYRDPAAVDARGSYRYPWVRLHAIRDYYSMAAIAAEHDVRVTFNLTPVLLRQIDDYLDHGATDGAFDLTRCPAERLTRGQVEELLSTFFDADWHNQIYVHPRYRELFEQRTAGARFSRQDLRDLQMWFNLAWFGPEFRAGDVRLVTGETVQVHRFTRRQRGFSHDDVLAMVEDQYKILRAVVPIHRALQDAGRIEVSTTPGFHPILPLLIDTDAAYIDRPGSSHPTRYAYPDDAAAHVNLACHDYLARFGRPPGGMWPAEGAVSSAAVQMLGRASVSWLATDAGADAAADEFVRALQNRMLSRLGDDEDRVLTIALDGENAWGGYPDDGRPFLHALYSRLSSDSRLKTVTFSEYLLGNPSRSIQSHPTAKLTRVHDLATGSWIDEPGSSPGVDLGTWIGEPEENAAWNLLGAARSAVARAPAPGAGVDRAHQSLLAAEGSDWFWWFGSDQESRNDAEFDELFRDHLRDAYDALDLEPPDSIDDSIVPHPVVWTFTHPVSAIRRQQQVSIRTNCPGRLTYQIDDGRERVETLVAVGGVMAGARRFQVTLGPFRAPAQRLAFHFFCEHPGCSHEFPCCMSGGQSIILGRTRAPRAAVTRSTADGDVRVHREP